MKNKEIISDELISKRIALLRETLQKFAHANEIEYSLNPIKMEDVLAYETKHNLKLPANFVALLTLIGCIEDPFLNYSAINLSNIEDEMTLANAKSLSILNSIDFIEDNSWGPANFVFYPDDNNMGESLDYLKGTLNLGTGEDDDAEIRLVLNGEFAGTIFVDKYTCFGEGPVYYAGELLNVLIENFNVESKKDPIFA